MLLESRPNFKPYTYPFAYQAWELQQRVHWVHSSIPMGDDIKDWHSEMGEEEKAYFKHVLRYFTQADVNVHSVYKDQYSKIFPHPELQQMFSAFENMETVHINAYAYLLDCLGLHDFEEFREFEEFKRKELFIDNYKINPEDPYSVALGLAAYGAFTEGFQLYGNFAALLCPSRFGKLKGVGQIVTWSVRDEALHADSLIHLYQTLVKEYRLSMKELKPMLEQCAKDVYENEVNFVNALYDQGSQKGLSRKELLSFLDHLITRRCKQVGIASVAETPGEPLLWFTQRTTGNDRPSFFETHPTAYNK
jgi:ribonucleoside-diphosphate reductase beta chain